MDIRFRNGVDESSVKGVVDEGGVGVGDVGGGIGQSIPSIFLSWAVFQWEDHGTWNLYLLIPRGSKGSIGESIDEGSHSGRLVGGAGEGHGGKGEQSLGGKVA